MNEAYIITEIGIYVSVRIFSRQKCVVGNARIAVRFKRNSNNIRIQLI